MDTIGLMKFSIQLMTCASFAFLVSCGSEQENDTNNDGTSGETEMYEDTEEIYNPEEPTVSEFLIEEMPKEWLLLEGEGDEALAIHDYWDCQERALYIRSTEEGNWVMDIGMCQDTDQGDITDFQAEIKEGEGISKVSGSFSYNSGFQGPLEVEFEWDQMIRQGMFSGLSSEEQYYVPRENADWYETITYEREED